MENSPTRVLIIDTAWLGDVLFSTALVGAVRAVWPDTQIQLLTSPRSEQLVLHHPELAKVWVFDKSGKQSGLPALKRLARSLNQEHFDLVLCAHPSFRSRLLCSMLKVPTRVGHSGFLKSFAFTHVVHNDLGVEPDHVQRRLNLLRAVHPVETTPPIKIGINPDEQQWAVSWISERHFDNCELLALVPGSARKTKQWSPDSFQMLNRRWLEQGSNHRTLIFLGPNERHLVDAFANNGDSRQTIVSESLRHCGALLSRCTVAVGNDTGVSFLAIAAGCPKVVVIYGSTQVNYAFPSPHTAVAAGVPCCLPRTGHGEATCRWSSGPPWCMAQISVDRVLGEIR